MISNPLITSRSSESKGSCRYLVSIDASVSRYLKVGWLKSCMNRMILYVKGLFSDMVVSNESRELYVCAQAVQGT